MPQSQTHPRLIRLAEDLRIDAQVGFAEADEPHDVDIARLLRQLVSHGSDGKRGCALDGVAVDTRADGRKRDRAHAESACLAEHAAVARFEPLRLAPVPAVPDWPDRVNDPANRQAMASGDARFTGGATAYRTALVQEAWAGRAMNGAIYAATAEQRFVRGVDDGVDSLLRDVAAYGFESGHGPHCSVWGSAASGSLSASLQPPVSSPPPTANGQRPTAH
jgi:hypothetical protein